MGVYANAGIDFTAIGSGMAESMSAWLNAEVEIFDANMRDLEWDPVTNAYGEDVETVIWSGKARIQPVSNVGKPYVGAQSGSIRNVLLHVPIAEVGDDVKPGMMIRVKESGNDPFLANSIFVIESAVNSSYAWVRTLFCTSDIKNVG